MIHEKELIEGCCKKDRLAQRTLYERFSGKMFAVCQRYTHSAFEAEDVLQDAFVKVFAQIHTFRFECPLEAWVKRVVVNTAISYLRKEKQWHENSVDVDDYAHSIGESEKILSGIGYEQLLEMIQTLPTGCRTIFNLHAIEGYGHQEIAETLGIAEGTVKSQYSRAKQLLQKKVSLLYVYQ